MNKIARIFAFIGIIAMVVQVAYKAFMEEWPKYKAMFPDPVEEEEIPEGEDATDVDGSPVKKVYDPIPVEGAERAFEREGEIIRSNQVPHSVTGLGNA